MSKFDATQADAIKRDNRAMEGLGVDSSMLTVLEDLYALISAGSIGITASAADVDTLALGANHFGQDSATTTGLTFGYKAGRFNNGLAIVSVAAGTILLSASQTNYVEVDRAGTVSTNTSGFTSGRLPLYLITTGSSTISVVTNRKTLLTLIGTAGVVGSMLSTMGATKEINLNLGDIAATTTFRVTLPNNAGVIPRINFLPGSSVAASDSTYWTFGVINKGAAGSGTTVVVDGTAAANSTKVTGGSAIVANVVRSLTLTGVGADLIHAANDVLEITITKTSTPAALNGCSLRTDSTFTG